jgi:hypothetical protein
MISSSLPTPLASPIREVLSIVFYQLYAKDNFRDELVIKPRNGPSYKVANFWDTSWVVIELDHSYRTAT